jgi:hypothetical protein
MSVRLGVLPPAEVSQFDVTESRLDSFSIPEIEMNYFSQAQTSEVCFFFFKRASILQSSLISCARVWILLRLGFKSGIV